MKINNIDEVNRTIVNNCDSCGGDHEVMLKNCNDRLKAQGFSHWFECPQHGQGGPVMITVPIPEAPKVEETSEPVVNETV